MKKLILLLGFVFFTLSSNCQIWTYKSGGNAFDGTYRTSSIIGKGDEFPYNDPVFVINVFRNEVNNPNIYLTNVPYAGCDNKSAKIVFDAEDRIYYFSVKTNEETDSWFLHLYSQEEFDDFIKNIKAHSKMSIRLQSDCVKYDCVFSLNGSTAAINFVLNTK